MNLSRLHFGWGLLLAFLIEIVQPTCVLESEFGFTLNCAFKKSGLFRVRNLGGLKAHASLGFSLGDELGFGQSLTNLDSSRRRSVNLKNGPPPNIIDEATVRSSGKQEKRGKQNRIMMRPPAPPNRPNKAAMDKLTSLHRRASSTMRPIVVIPTIESPTFQTRDNPSVTLAKPLPMGVPAFKPLPPKEETLKVIPVTATTKKTYTPLQIPQSKGPGLVYQSENYPHISHEQVSKMVSQLTASHIGQPFMGYTTAPVLLNSPKYYSMPTTMNPFLPMPVAAPPTQAAISIIPAPVFTNSLPFGPSMKSSYSYNKYNNQNPLIPISNFVDPVPHQVHDIANAYNVYNTKKVDDYNSITGYEDDNVLKFNKEDINSKIAEIAKAGNISMEAVEAAIALRQQQLLSKYANIAVPMTSAPTASTSTEQPLVFQQEPEPDVDVSPVPSKPKRIPTSGKVMNAPREYYPVGYEKNFDDHFQSKVDLPETNFNCGDQKYFPGLYGDESLGCMVFHVCALTDDGLVMKSFLCPESTLFDQTILKCNWWFYVDCKNTRKLYDTNIPVSKSYQLMKALTFFSSYNKEMQDDANHSANPEDVAGIKEAISILENQEGNLGHITNTPNVLEIITPAPYIDERNNHKENTFNTSNESFAPIYRGNRNYKDKNTNNSTQELKKTIASTNNTKDEVKLVAVNANINVLKQKQAAPDNTPNNTTSVENSTEKRHRRRMTLKHNPPSNKSVLSTTSTTTVKIEKSTIPPTDIVTQDIRTIQDINDAAVKQETLIDELEDTAKLSAELLVQQATAPVRRFHRSSAEKDLSKEVRNVLNDSKIKEIEIVNNEKVHIVRPTPLARFVGEFQSPSATIAKLDEAVLGSSIRTKRGHINFSKPQIHEIRSPTYRNRT